jgi:chemotaxis protein CheD
MNTSVDNPPRRAEHCGVVHNLRIKGDLPQAVRRGASATSRLGPPRANRISLYIGEVAASHAPIVLDTLLGSCVAVCVYDPVLRAGGMNHILLPACRAGDRSPRCGIYAMELLINEVMKLGGDRKRFVAKAFGGAKVLQGVNMLPIGDKNSNFVREFLATERIPLVAERLGGSHAVHLYFRTDTGKATVHTLDGSSLPKILSAERSYWKQRSADRASGDDIVLF